MKKKIKDKLKELESINKSFPKVKYKISFNLKSKRVMGYYRYRRNKKDVLAFNLSVAKAVGFKQFKEVVIHEYGHMITRYIYGYGIRVHGKEWRKVMYSLGSVKPRATITFGKGSESFKTEFKMKCKCSVHLYSKNKRTRLRNGTVYRCDNCKKKIKEK